MKRKTRVEISTDKAKYDKQIAMRVSIITVIINIILSVFKLLAGIIAHSGAMISDAIHSASDVLSTFVVMLGVTLSNKTSDEEHPYGHERMECVCAIILAVMLAATGLGIGYSGFEKITGHAGELKMPGTLALIAAVASIVVKEGMYWYTRSAAKKIKSGALMADAWHHRSDALSSVGAFIGIFGAMIGFPILDPIASVVICAFIIKVAIDIFKDAVNKMVDKSAPKELMLEMQSLIEKQDGVERVDVIKTRMFSAKLYVDVEIGVDGELKLIQSHAIAERVHDLIEQNFEDVKHCMVHVNPVEK